MLNNRRTNKRSVPKAVSEYMSQIGTKGGQISRRTLTPKQVKALTAARRKYHLELSNYRKLYGMTLDEARAHHRATKGTI